MHLTELLLESTARSRKVDFWRLRSSGTIPWCLALLHQAPFFRRYFFLFFRNCIIIAWELLKVRMSSVSSFRRIPNGECKMLMLTLESVRIGITSLCFQKCRGFVLWQVPPAPSTTRLQRPPNILYRSWILAQRYQRQTSTYSSRLQNGVWLQCKHWVGLRFARSVLYSRCSIFLTIGCKIEIH